MEVTRVVFLILLASVLGSFATVLAFRLPREMTLGGRSKCPSCEAKVRARDNLPLVSYLLLRGKCRTCHAEISREYPLIEATSIVLALLVVLRQGSFLLELAAVFYVSLGLALSVIDIRVKRLPNALVGSLLVLLTVLLAVDSRHDLKKFITAMGLGLAYSVFLWALRVVSRGGMGLGDVKFAFPLGMLVGYLSFEAFLVAICVAFVVGALVGVLLMSFGKAGRKTAIPFGPFLYIGGVVGLFVGGLSNR